MKLSNYISAGNIILAKPPHNVNAGELFHVNKLVLVAITNGTNKWPISAYTQGCFEFPVIGNVEPGTPIYYLNGYLSSDNSDPNAMACGFAYAQVTGSVWEIMLVNNITK
jgi:predicted RecA/RadA family phage recombinase